MAKKTILVADDCSEDVFILKRALIKAGIDVPLTVVQDGQQVVDYLSGEEDFADRMAHPLPHLLLLDIKMPKLDGFDVLRWLQKHPKLKRMPVAVLTSSNEDNDVDKAYDLGANSYLVKPGSLNGYVNIVETLYSYWTKLNRPPTVIARQ